METAERLSDIGVTVSFQIVGGMGHEISPKVVTKLADWALLKLGLAE